MEFNSYVWKLYRESASGVEAIRRYSNLSPEFVGDDRLLVFESDGQGSEGKKGDREIDLVGLISTHASQTVINSIKEACDFYDGCVHGIAVDLADHPDDFFRFGHHPTDWYDYVAEVSL